MVGSASISIADRPPIDDPYFYLMRHLGALAIGGCGMLVAMAIPTELWYRASWLMLVAAFGLLIVVLVPSLGHAVNGARRWLDVGPVTLQASEPARLCLLLYLAGYAVRRTDELAASLMGLTKPMLVVGVAAGFLLLEPDFGASVVLIATSLGVLFVGGARLRDFALAVVVGGTVLAVARLLVGVPARAAHEVLGSMGRSIRRRLPAHAVADRDRPRRVDGRRPR